MNNKISLTHRHSGADVARALGVNPSTVCRWVKDMPGFPQPIRISRLIQLHDLKAIRQFLAERSKQQGGA